MIGKTPRIHQMTFFEVALERFIDMNHELVQLSKAIDWAVLESKAEVESESEFSGYYCSDNGRPGVPIRKMVGLMLLKNIYDLSDEEIVARWMENPYMQYFTGETVFQKRPPINPADFSKFRKRAGIEPVIGHLKSDHRMIRNSLQALVRQFENMIFENQQQYPRLHPHLATAVKWGFDSYD